MATKKNMSGRTVLGYTTKVGKSLEGIVGKDFALAYSSMAQGQWNNTAMVFVNIAHDIYVDVAKILSGNDDINDETGAGKYMPLALNLSAMAYKMFKRHGKITDGDVSLLAVLINKIYGIDKATAETLASLVKKAYNKEREVK